jgi:hypothetical protein
MQQAADPYFQERSTRLRMELLDSKLTTLLDDLIRLANDNSQAINDTLKLCEEYNRKFGDK